MTAAPPAGLIKYAKARSDEVVSKLKKAQRDIETEINMNQGIYPYNGGRLSQAELCRRARITQATLSTTSHRNSTRKMVSEWLIAIHGALVTGRNNVRRAVTDRAEYWKEQHGAIVDNYRVAELEMLDMRRELKRLRSENEALRSLLKTESAAKVVSIPKENGRSPR